MGFGSGLAAGQGVWDLGPARMRLQLIPLKGFGQKWLSFAGDLCCELYRCSGDKMRGDAVEMGYAMGETNVWPPISRCHLGVKVQKVAQERKDGQICKAGQK